MIDLSKLIENKSELTHSKAPPEPIVLSSRIRLARNLDSYTFPGWSKPEVRQEVLNLCLEALRTISPFKTGSAYILDELNETEKQLLVERHLISPEFANESQGAGIVFSKDQSASIMINEEDHLRIQVLRSGYKFKPIWKTINEIDNAIEKQLNYAFSPELGFLTACPTNIGTGLRGSVMMHLPGLVIAGQMEKVIRACSQLNLAVRGIYGEGSEASGSIFQISNQQTLGEPETQIISRLTGVLDTVIEQERNARSQLLQLERDKVFDKIGRAFGILRNGYYINSAEAMNLLSLMRLGADFNIVTSKHRRMIDRLFIETQPAHIQVLAGGDVDPNYRDTFRADLCRSKFRTINSLHFNNVQF